MAGNRSGNAHNRKGHVVRELLKKGVTHPITSCLAALVLVLTSWLWRHNIRFEMEDPTNWAVPILGIATFVALSGAVFNAALNKTVARIKNMGGPIILREEIQHIPQIAGFMLRSGECVGSPP